MSGSTSQQAQRTIQGVSRRADRSPHADAARKSARALCRWHGHVHARRPGVGAGCHARSFAGRARLPGGFKSLTREEYKAMLGEVYPFTLEEQPAGGTVILGSTSSSNLTTVNPFFADNFPTQDINTLDVREAGGRIPRSGAEFGAVARRATSLSRVWPTTMRSRKTAGPTRSISMPTQRSMTARRSRPAMWSCLRCPGKRELGQLVLVAVPGTLESWTAIDEKTFQWVTLEAFPQIVVFPNIWAPILADEHLGRCPGRGVAD